MAADFTFQHDPNQMWWWSLGASGKPYNAGPAGGSDEDDAARVGDVSQRPETMACPHGHLTMRRGAILSSPLQGFGNIGRL